MLSEISPKLKLHSRVKVNAHGVSVGFLLVYECMVFGDTSDNIDEVFSPRFFIVYPSVGTNFIDSVATQVNR